MPWKECSVMDERMQFVARRLDGETMVELCREFGISRKTGYKIFDRYEESGLEALTDRCAPALALRQSVAATGRERHPDCETREAALGRAQDP